ncbi:MAG: Gfo/Idh/MocA family oxidoreductase, partial [Phycisphaeraceae bacterium]
MILVDTALKQREQDGNPIRVGLVGAGFMARGVVHQLLTPVKGIRLVAIYNRSAPRLHDLLDEAGVVSHKNVSDTKSLEEAVHDGKLAIADDPRQLCEAGNIDLVIECTGKPEFGASVALSAIENGKHIILINAELDATLGPILKHKANRAGVVYTNVDGDEPGGAMNLWRVVETI